MQIMTFKNWVKLAESVKDGELNRILDRISNGEDLTDNEKKFLGNFNDKGDDYYQDFQYLTSSDTFDRIVEILDSGRKIYYEVYEDSFAGGEVISIDYKGDDYLITLNGGEKVKLKDSFLYNLIYNIKKDDYALRVQDRYYEKIPIKNEN